MPSSKNNFYSYETYLSPFTIRYGSPQMRFIWSEIHKRLLWRKIWVGLARAEYKAGIVSKRELDDIVAHQHDIDVVQAKKVEKEIYHELMAEITLFAKQCKIGGGKIHAGATSTDILDNTTSIQIHESLHIVKEQLKELLTLFADKIAQYQDVVCMGYTHLQPAEPTTVAYRLCFYAQDLLMDLQFLEKILPLIKGKGIKGAVGTSAGYTELLKGTKITAKDFEKDILREIGLDAVAISGQTYPRKIDLLVIELLSNIAASLHKFCFDYRIMQSPGFGEWIEQRDSKRVGSSAMPFKKNPDKAEKVCSLARYVSSLFSAAWSNPANSLLERTLDDSANQRIFLPEGFLGVNECLTTTTNLLKSLTINTIAVTKNLASYGQFTAVEPLLMKLVKQGANRQEMHDIIKSCSMKVWQGREEGKPFSLFALLAQEKEITRFLSKEKLKEFVSPLSHTGCAKEKAKAFLVTINTALNH